MKEGEVTALVDAIYEGVKMMLESVANPLRERIAALERRTDELRSVSYQGVWQRARDDYRRGSITTHDSCVWIALRDSPVGPPDASDGWQLIAKPKPIRPPAPALP